MKNVKISVIVPVYNAEKYLHLCVESVLRQTHQNFELLLIVDGATDCSTEICHEFAKNDSRIIVVEKQNEGVSATRNRGLAMACGEYICFIDADDRVTEDYLEKLLKAVLENNAQMALCQYAFERRADIISSGEPVFVNYDRNTDNLFEQYIRGLYRLDGAAYILGSACRSIFLRTMLLENSITFPPCKLHEDQLFLLSAMATSDRIAAVNDVMYYYNDADSGSAVRKLYKTDLLQDQIVYLDNLKLRLKELPITTQEQKKVWQYALLHVRKLLMTNAVMNPNSTNRTGEIWKIRESSVFEDRIPRGIYWKWFTSQPVKTKIAEFLLHMRMYALLRVLRSHR